MGKILSFACMMLACVSVSAQNWGNFARYEKANSEVKGSPKIVFMGDSITDNWAKFRPDFFRKHNFLGRGISGQVSSQMLLRFERDVVELKPKKVAILCGINDIAKNKGDISLDDVARNISAMCDIAKANGIEPIVCLVLPAEKFLWRPNVAPNPSIAKLNKLIRQIAKDKKLLLVDYNAPMTDENGKLRHGRINKDGKPDTVHPNAEGYKIMEKVFLDTLNAARK